MTKTSLVFSFVLVATGLVAACFNTKNIQSGGLKCAPSSDPNSPGVCPDGFFCGEGHLCYRNGTQGVALCKAGERLPFGPQACFAPDPQQITSTCDPVCQSGCSCERRCQLTGDLNGGYSFDCVAPPGPPQIEVFQACDETKDLCKPGLSCLPPPGDSIGCISRCTRYCRADVDCPQDSQCIFQIDLAGDNRKVLICSPPAVVCDPVQNGPATVCNPLTGDACYVFSDRSPDLTMCDCAGTIKAGGACQVIHSCEPGHECVGGTCRKLCSLSAIGGCPSREVCTRYSTSTKFGICQ
jgi:hypothetical protein